MLREDDTSSNGNTYNLALTNSHPHRFCQLTLFPLLDTTLGKAMRFRF